MSSQAFQDEGSGQVGPNDVYDFQHILENIAKARKQRPLHVPETPIGYEETRLDVSNLHIGDTNIHTTGPVFSAPVTIEQHITQHTIQHINVQQAASSQEPNLETEARQKCKELKSLLKEKVESIANEESSLADFSQRPITPVNLSMVSKPQQINDEFQAEGHFRKRQDFAKIYDRPTGDITAEQILDRAKQQAKKEAESKFTETQVKAKQYYIEKHGNTVGVSGQGGIGKTTFLKKLALQALGGHIYGNISFFFYIAVRVVNFKTTMTFLQFLLHTMLPGWNCNLLVANEILNQLSSDPNVVILVDGLDEAAFKSFSAKAPVAMLDDKNMSEVYLKNLAGGQLLPRARKIFTSRPAPLYKLHPSHRPQFVVQILGLTPNSQRELGQQLCGEKYNSVEEILEQNLNLFVYCYVPVNFILTVHYLMNYDGDIQFASLSRILSFTCIQYSQTEHLKGGECELGKLATMAWNGFRDKKIVFSSEDFKSVNMTKSTANAFLNTFVTTKGNLKLTILDGFKKKYFSHLIWQEFFAAVYLMMIMPYDEFRKHHTKLSKDRWEVVARFAFGICDCSVFNELEAVVSKPSRDVCKAKKLQLRNLASTCMEKQTKEEILRSCSWAHEANDEEITLSVSSSLPDVIDFSKSLREPSLIPTDVENLSFVIQRRMKPLKYFNVWNNKIGDRGAALIGNCIHNTEEVDLRDCDLTSLGAEYLSKQIKELNTPLKMLSLHNNDIGDQGAAFIGDCIHNTEEVHLGECELTSVGAEHLSKTISNLKIPMKALNLSVNNIGDRGAASIGDCIYNLEEVYLNGCGLKSPGVEYLSNKIKNLEIPMRALHLSGNSLTDECAEALAACVHNIERLVAVGCGFTQVGKDLIKSKSRGKVEIW